MTERPPDTGLEERVVRALIASRDIHPRQRWRWMAPVAAVAAAVLTLVLVHPWSVPQNGGPEYILLLHDNPGYQWPRPGHITERIGEYARWAEGLDRAGELRFGGRVDGGGDINGLFIIRAKNQAQADSIAAASPHAKYGGRVEVRPFDE
jgi:hypothetical protein